MTAKFDFLFQIRVRVLPLRRWTKNGARLVRPFQNQGTIPTAIKICSQAPRGSGLVATLVFSCPTHADRGSPVEAMEASGATLRCQQQWDRLFRYRYMVAGGPAIGQYLYGSHFIITNCCQSTCLQMTDFPLPGTPGLHPHL